MKRVLYVLLIPFIAVCSCAKDNSISMGSVSVYESRGNSVSISDVRWLVSASEQTKGNLKGIEIIPCVDKDNDTLAFAVNYEKGWTLYSADKRVPPILAESDRGDFKEISCHPGVKEWISRSLENIKVIKRLDNEMLNFTEEEIRNCQEFWAQTLNPYPHQPSGHYELHSTNTIVEVCDSIPHLLSTKWNQSYPFNAYCPYVAGSTTTHCPAGCVAIAGAQMLYYLHYYYGVPECAPSTAYCYSDENDFPYYWDQGGDTSSIWDFMPLTGDGEESFNTNAAPLIAEVGNYAIVTYTHSGSYANTYFLHNVFNLYYGISSYYGEYNQTTVRQSLINEMPVIVWAGDEYIVDSHAFIIDGYLRKRTVTTSVYRWVWDSPGGNGMYPIIQPEDRIEIQTSQPYIDLVRMNWGNPIQWEDNNGWYTLTDDWYVSFGTYVYNFSEDRNMIYGFAPINQ